MPDTKIVRDEEVTIEMAYSSPRLPEVFGEQPTTLTFAGKIVGRADYDPKDSLRITGDNRMPIRVITFAKIVSYNGKPFKYTPTVAVDPKKPAPPKVVKVEGSKPGKFYDLTISADGSKMCSCPGFGFRGSCKHIDNYKAE
jgi:hypothetical protein